METPSPDPTGPKVVWDGSSNYDKYLALFQKGLETAHNNRSKGHHRGGALLTHFTFLLPWNPKGRCFNPHFTDMKTEGPRGKIAFWALKRKGKILPSQERIFAQPGPSSVAIPHGLPEHGEEQVRKATPRGSRHTAPRRDGGRSPTTLKGTGSVACHFHDVNRVFVAICPSQQWPRPSAAPLPLAAVTAKGTRVQQPSPPACLPGWG